MHVRFLPCWLAALTAASTAVVAAPVNQIDTARGPAVIEPVSHATFVIKWNGRAIYVDPVGGKDKFAAFPPPDLILITDIHGDHTDAATVAAIMTKTTTLVVPAAVKEKLATAAQKRARVLGNGQSMVWKGASIEAVPMYNLSEERKSFHEKGRGNGYVLTLGKKRFYVSGDTEDIPEMRALKDVDAAFVCMNLPYTMSVEQAAEAVRAFKPKVVFPYHYRGKGGLSDVGRFEKLVSTEPGIEVRRLDWYPEAPAQK